MKFTTKVALLYILFFTANFANSQSIFGKWKTIDDRTGNPKAVINIYQKDGLMYGVVEKIVEPGKENALCVKCDGDLKDKPVLGMTIIEGLKENENGVWKGDTLFDPEQAMTFRCKIWLNPDNSDELKVRGYLAFIYRTQTWVRADG
ncbi:DUF2147 domain-containing protein [Aurantibacter crassamenti]|uniref:DUF2147 domain-containing protein n=1 Tax=Aurantibacter crassamenti TaxID=1837375 RepID=UPI00193ACE08|nr:DUF2147 domain-containing protein [Aurantibacter crassamenti]MBM1107552.1 DUF2147 domain-containing protein [Aurantibacter crassamenti]